MAGSLQLRAMLRSKPGQKATRPHHRDPAFAVPKSGVTGCYEAKHSTGHSPGRIWQHLRLPAAMPERFTEIHRDSPRSQDVPPAPPPSLGLPSRPRARRDGASGISQELIWASRCNRDCNSTVTYCNHLQHVQTRFKKEKTCHLIT